jgi:transposase
MVQNLQAHRQADDVIEQYQNGSDEEKTLHKRCAGLDVHKEVVACLRLAIRGKATHEVPTMTRGLLELADWLEQAGCAYLAMEATVVYWKPILHILEGWFRQILANSAHIKGIPGRKRDMYDATWIADLLAHGLIRATEGGSLRAMARAG